jgi:hypothetical protein
MVLALSRRDARHEAMNQSSSEIVRLIEVLVYEEHAPPRVTLGYLKGELTKDEGIQLHGLPRASDVPSPC